MVILIPPHVGSKIKCNFLVLIEEELFPVMKTFNLILLLLAFCTTLHSQINIRSVDVYSVKDGLSQNSVHKILQDSRGLIWLGTEGGLNKFNGYEITSFHSTDSRNVLSSRGTIFDIMEDKNGNMWYGSSGLISRLNIQNETIDNLNMILKGDYELNFGAVLSMFVDSKNNIWFGTFGQGLYRISSGYNQIKHFINDPDSTGDSSFDYVRDFYEDNSGIIWIATYNGLVKYDREIGKLENLFYPNGSNRYYHTVINKIIPSNNELLLLTNNNGLLTFDPAENKLRETSTELNKQLKEFNLRDGVIDEKGRLWICGYGGGVFIINLNDFSLTDLSNCIDPKLNSDLSACLSVQIDRSGIVWIGTRHAGLMKIELGSKDVYTINNTIPGYEILRDNVVTGTAKDKFNNIWLAVQSGLFKINSELKTIAKLSLSSELTATRSIYNIEFTNKYAWLSYGPYLVKYHLTSDRYEKIPVEENGTVTEIHILNSDTLILGSSRNKIYIYSTTDGVSESISLGDNSALSTSVLDIFSEHKDNLWVSTNNGLFKIDLSQENISVNKIPLNLRIDFVTSLTSNDNKKLWFGTYGDGLFSFDIYNSELNHFTTKDGLPDNTIYGVMFDSQNNLWMSSNKGIFEFDTDKHTVRTINPNDLQGYEFNSKAYYKAHDGELLYGGVNGLNYFYPVEIQINKTPPLVLIDRITMNDSIIATNVQNNANNVFEFDHDENYLMFEFTALDFHNPAKNSYEYRLEGINNNWINSGNKRYATYPNINPGEYKFIVRGSNSDQVFGNDAALFSFVIHPPFWATWWFRSVFILLVFSTIYLIYKMRINEQAKRIQEIEKVRKKIADDFHDDLGHKLTRISLYSEMLKNQSAVEPGKLQYINKISDAANSLFYETKDFIWSIDPDNDTVYDVLVYLKDFGDEFFSRSAIAFKVDEISEQFKSYKLPMKWKREVILIFKEAMNNALKHSKAEAVELKAELSQSELIISLYDNGQGFDVKNIDSQGRGIKSIEKRAEAVKGNLEIKAGERGTQIKLSVKIIEDA